MKWLTRPGFAPWSMTAVGLGVVFALLMQLNREALDLRIVELVTTGTGSFLEKPAPSHLKSNHALLLDIGREKVFADVADWILARV